MNIFEEEGKLKKSRVLLYPLLGIKEEPLDTFLYWEDRGIDNFELIVLYDREIKNIIENEFLISCYKVDVGELYIFDLIRYNSDVYNFIEGRYSRFSKNTKIKIRQFYGSSPTEPKKALDIFTIDVALWPEFYIKQAKENLGYSENDDFTSELYSKYNKSKETCNFVSVLNKNCKKEKIITF